MTSKVLMRTSLLSEDISMLSTGPAVLRSTADTKLRQFISPGTAWASPVPTTAWEGFGSHPLPPCYLRNTSIEAANCSCETPQRDESKM